MYKSRAPRFDTVQVQHTRIRITTLVHRDALRQATLTTEEGLITVRHYLVKKNTNIVSAVIMCRYIVVEELADCTHAMLECHSFNIGIRYYF